MNAYPRAPRRSVVLVIAGLAIACMASAPAWADGPLDTINDVVDGVTGALPSAEPSVSEDPVGTVGDTLEESLQKSGQDPLSQLSDTVDGVLGKNGNGGGGSTDGSTDGTSGGSKTTRHTGSSTAPATNWTTGAPSQSTYHRLTGGTGGADASAPSGYAGLLGDGIQATAGRLVTLAGPMAPPILLAGLAIAMLLSFFKQGRRIEAPGKAVGARSYKL